MLVADRVGAHGRHVGRGPVTDTAAGTIAIGVFEAERARVAAALVRRRAAELATGELHWELPDGAGDEVMTGLVTGTVFGAYRFDRFKPSQGPAVPRSLHLHGGGDDRVRGAADD